MVYIRNMAFTTIKQYNDAQSTDNKAICELLNQEIDKNLKNVPHSNGNVWHGAPVWFLNKNPVVGYSVLKDSVRLLFWSGQSFEEEGLQNEGSFKAAEARFTSPGQINKDDLKRWLKKAHDIQWDYKNIVKRRGQLERLK